MSQPEHEPIEFSPLKRGQFCWTEIASNDAEKCMDFYSNVFGWTFKKGDAGGMQYNEFSTGGDHPVGGLYQMDPKWFGEHMPPPHYMSYVLVDDVDESAKKVLELGGAVMREPMDIPNVGRFSIITDPTGAHIAIFKPGPRQ